MTIQRIEERRKALELYLNHENAFEAWIEIDDSPEQTELRNQNRDAFERREREIDAMHSPEAARLGQAKVDAYNAMLAHPVQVLTDDNGAVILCTATNEPVITIDDLDDDGAIVSSGATVN